MNIIKTLIIILIIAFLGSCNTDDSSEPSTIVIEDYVLNFPSTFTLEELPGIDSYVGEIRGSGMILTFDYGWYTSGNIYLEENEYTVTEDEFQGYYRQVLKPLNSETNLTRLYTYKITDSIEALGSDYNRLTIYTNNIDSNEQNMIIDVFNSIEIVE